MYIIVLKKIILKIVKISCFSNIPLLEIIASSHSTYVYTYILCAYRFSIDRLIPYHYSIICFSLDIDILTPFVSINIYDCRTFYPTAGP